MSGKKQKSLLSFWEAKAQKTKAGRSVDVPETERETVTSGTTNSYCWCSVCRQENSCGHQGVADVQRHIKSKAHQSKEQALQSTSRIGQFYPPVTVGGMTAQESKVTGFDPEDLAVDVGHWFRGSTNRKGYLTEFCDLHESEYMEILSHISIRWLSLEHCLNRILQQYKPLSSYFKSANEKQPRFTWLADALSNPITEVYLLFYQATLPAFSSLNLLLQKEKSSVFLLYEEVKYMRVQLCLCHWFFICCH
ncbi:uncharacterized protein LOC132885202 [Neoarius graeffei]|uniref:uncharacterized protein LOC132885202 n=1 Tax=Neoarius graeffei TaxID=443677 RepID=UPI00298CDB8F|nr:uncharacterized protein LOC132885202 [Neoarius graeffei]